MPDYVGDKPEVDILSVTSYTEPDEYTMKGRPFSKRGWKEDKKRATYDLPESLIERFASFLQDEEYLSLDREIALLRSMLNGMLIVVKAWELQANHALAEGKEVQKPAISVNQLLAAVDNVGKMVERQHRLVYGDVNTITVQSAVLFVFAIADIAQMYVKDPQALTAIHKALRELLTNGTGFKINLEVARRLLDPNYSFSDYVGGEKEQDSARNS